MTFVELMQWYYAFYTATSGRLIFFFSLIALAVSVSILIKQLLDSWLK